MRQKDFTFYVIAIITIAIAFGLFINFFKKKDIHQINFLNNYAVISESSLMKAPKNEPNYFFQKGWLRQGQKYLMTLPKSTLRFFSLEKKERTIYIELSKSNFFKDVKKIKIELILNGIPFKELDIYDKNNSHILTASEKFIKTGNNILEIYVNKKQHDKHTQKGYLFLNKFIIKEYKRRKSFKFENNNDVAKVTQPSQSGFEYYILPQNKEILHYSFFVPKVYSREEKIGEVLIKIKRQDREEKLLKKIVLHNKSKKQYSGMLKLEPYSNEIIRLSFNLFSHKPYLSIVWNKLFVENKKKEIVEQKSNKFFKKKPHVFLIIIDAARYDRFGFSGYNNKIAPRINEFAKKSFNFVRFFAQAPYTTASVASMFSGAYPETHTVRYKNDELPHNVISTAEYLNQNKYITNIVSGSIALKKNNLTKGFNKTLNIRSTKKWNGSSMQIEKLKNFIKESDFTKPNFFYIHLLPPHEPYIPPSPFNSIFTETSRKKLQKRIRIRDRANLYSNIDNDYASYLHKCYLNNLNYADFLVGEIIDKLKSIDIFNESMIMVSSDHAEAFFEHLQLGHNTTNYNDMIHIPFLLKMPQQKKGIEIKSNFGLIDITPTILELLGIKPQKNMQGISFAPILFGEQNKHKKRFLYSRTASKNFNIALIYDNYKYIYYSGRGELYDIENDPNELNDISDNKPLLAGLLRQEVFIKMFENIKLRKKNNIIRKQVKNKKKYQEELKSLGYL